MPLRLRVRYTTWPRPALELTDTPRPKCPDCRGKGGWTEYRADGPESDITEWEFCGCWKPARAWLLLPIPRRLTKRTAAGWGSNEAPF